MSISRRPAAHDSSTAHYPTWMSFQYAGDLPGIPYVYHGRLQHHYKWHVIVGYPLALAYRTPYTAYFTHRLEAIAHARSIHHEDSQDFPLLIGAFKYHISPGCPQYMPHAYPGEKFQAFYRTYHIEPYFENWPEGLYTLPQDPYFTWDHEFSLQAWALNNIDPAQSVETIIMYFLQRKRWSRVTLGYITYHSKLRRTLLYTALVHAMR